MKTLTIKQPWASLIIDGYKDIENRTWKTSYRGDLLIHAAKYDDNINLIMLPKEIRNALAKLPKNLPHSAILGKVTLYDIKKSTEDKDNVWGDENCYHWKIKDPIKFAKPIENVDGKLSIWDYDF